MRPIDAEELERAKFHPLPYPHITPSDVEVESYKRGWNDAIDAIVDNEPTVDAVEVVRCKDCRYALRNVFKRDKDVVICDMRGVYREIDDYCSDGERAEK